MQQLIRELNEILAFNNVDEGGLWKIKLTKQSSQLFELLPRAIQHQLMLERDPHGNVQVKLIDFCCYPLLVGNDSPFISPIFPQVAKIETEKMLIQMVEAELEKRKLNGSYKNHFNGISHFFGYFLRLFVQSYNTIFFSFIKCNPDSFLC